MKGLSALVVTILTLYILEILEYACLGGDLHYNSLY